MAKQEKVQTVAVRGTRVLFDGRDVGELESLRLRPGTASQPTSPANSLEDPTQEKYTLAEAFSYFSVPDNEEPSVSALNNERCIRSVSFLLDWLSRHGNEQVDGFAAHGLAEILQQAAWRTNWVTSEVGRA